MAKPLKLLIAENYEDDAILMVEQLRHYGYDPDWIRVETAAGFADAIEATVWDAILSDYSMVGFTGLDALRAYQQKGLDIPFILVSGSIGEERAVDMMRSGAHDYIIKDRLQRLAPAVERELRETVNRRERRESAAELRRLNLELEGKMKLLQQSTSDLKQFTSAAHHDLQEPLRIITNYAELLVRRHAGPTHAEEQEFAGFIEQAVERMRGLILGLARFSEATHQSETVKRSLCNATEVANDASILLTRMLEESGAEISIEPLPRVAADKGILLQIFRNLLSNAIKYRRAAEAPRIVVSGQEQDGVVRISVADNGIGIDAAHQQRIFELFQRLHGENFPGIGLGLALVKRLVENSGGQVGVQSAPGVGSTFFFTLPAFSARPAESYRLAASSRK